MLYRRGRPPQVRGDYPAGWALGELGQEEGIIQMHQGLSGLQAMGAELVRHIFLPN